jgi:hypothetical protein
VLVDHPVEEPFDESQQRASSVRRGALLAADNLQHVDLRDFANRPVSPCRDEDGAQVMLCPPTAPLLYQLVGDERLGDGGERMLDP